MPRLSISTFLIVVILVLAGIAMRDSTTKTATTSSRPTPLTAPANCLLVDLPVEDRLVLRDIRGLRAAIDKQLITHHL